LRRVRPFVLPAVATGSYRFQLNAGPFGQPANSLAERQVLTKLDKFNRISTSPAGKTLKYLLGRVDVHTWLVVSMKRTQTNHLLALFCQAKVFGDNLHYISGLLNPTYYTAVKFYRHTRSEYVIYLRITNDNRPELTDYDLKTT
jgi:hypothetical protein